ncbi:MAG: hypothetical protein KDA32_07870 [Phycisphaerales bacterium]|nr:hypothetical protein [Phycisphaerales bacterium]
MQRQIGALLRDAWWLMLAAIGVGVLFGFVVTPLLGCAVPVVLIPVFVYFALLRYDQTGKPRG